MDTLSFADGILCQPSMLRRGSLGGNAQEIAGMFHVRRIGFPLLIAFILFLGLGTFGILARIPLIIPRGRCYVGLCPSEWCKSLGG
jgi:hypothetical protein